MIVIVIELRTVESIGVGVMYMICKAGEDGVDVTVGKYPRRYYYN